MITDLESKLSPVMLPDPPDDLSEEKTQTPAPPASPVRSSLNADVIALFSLQRRITRLLDRVDL